MFENKYIKYIVEKVKENRFVCIFCAVMLSVFVLCVSFFDCGYMVRVEGKKFGIVSSAQEARNVLSDSLKEIRQIRGEDYKLKQPAYNVVFLKKNNFDNAEKIKKDIVTSFDGLVEAMGIYSDGEFAVAVSDKNTADKVLEKLKSQNLKKGTTVDFHNDVKILAVRTSKDNICSFNDAIEALKGYRETKKEICAEKNDTIESICERYNADIDVFKENNPGIEFNKIYEGQIVTVVERNKIIDFEYISTEEVLEDLKFSTLLKKDNNLYEDTTKVVSDGENGKEKITLQKTIVNGKVIKTKVLKKETVIEPKTKIVAVGTKVKPKNAPTGTFLLPYKGEVTSRFGSRWGRKHTGVDFGGSVGSDIKASDGGKVVFAGWNDGGYGNLIIIDHENGFESYYAHLNSICVQEGQLISQGEVIGTLGNSGRSTGAHLHFEIRKNGTAEDPFGYIEK